MSDEDRPNSGEENQQSPSLNPFAGSMPKASTSSKGTINPFATNSAGGLGKGTVNPFATSSTSSMQAQPVSTPSTTQPDYTHTSTQPNPELKSAEFTSHPPSSNQPSEDHASQGYSDRELRAQFDPLSSSMYTPPPNLISAPTTVTIEGVKLQKVRLIVGSSIFVSLLIGLLAGTACTERRAHNHRILAWQNIDKSMAQPIENFKRYSKVVDQLLQSKKIDFKVIKDLPEEAEMIPIELLSPGVSLSKPSLTQLNSVIQDMNTFSIRLQEHRGKTMANKAELDDSSSKKFSKQRNYFFYSKSLNKCLKNGKLSCRVQDFGGRIVASDGKLTSKKNVNILFRGSKGSKEVDPKDLLFRVSKGDVTGYGESPERSYALRLKELMDRRNALKGMIQSLQTMLDEKTSMNRLSTL